jgi:hypothetical protein
MPRKMWAEEGAQKPEVPPQVDDLGLEAAP